MEIRRPRTPPSSCLITPPPTGGFDKRVRFASTIDTDNPVISRRWTKLNEGEAPNDFFEDFEEGSEIGAYGSSENESIPSADDTAPSSPASSISTKRTILEKHDPFASLAFAIDAPTTVTDPFPFMKLPISVRKRIYDHLLVVPGLICVRQNHTSFHDEKKAFLYAEHRELLPGIAYALAQLTVDGYKIRFSRFSTTNINILCASKEIHTEAKAVLYGKNSFEIVRPTTEICPPVDFSIRLFPKSCQLLVTKLNIRVCSFYDLHWLLSGGHSILKNHYRGLDNLTLILEIESTSKGFGKKWAKKEQEKWTEYIKRLHGDLSQELFRKAKSRNTKAVPTWLNLHVLFSGESYDEKLNMNGVDNRNGDEVLEQAKRDELRQALVETWELFKKGGK